MKRIKIKIRKFTFSYISFCAFTVLVLALINLYPVFAYVMDSNNYRIQSDSLNSGGTENSESNNYIISDTVGEVGTGGSSSTNYNLKAGYRQMQEVSLSLSSPGDVNMLPNIPGITGGVATGEATWTVITDDAAGFSMVINASGSPALTSGANNFADYTHASASPDYAWSVADSTKEFGFTIEPATTSDTGALFMDNGSACGTGGANLNSIDTCWYGLNGVNNITIVSRTSRTDASGENEKVKFKAQLYNADGTPNDANGMAGAGAYQATITITALPL